MISTRYSVLPFSHVSTICCYSSQLSNDQLFTHPRRSWAFLVPGFVMIFMAVIVFFFLIIGSLDSHTYALYYLYSQCIIYCIACTIFSVPWPVNNPIYISYRSNSCWPSSTQTPQSKYNVCVLKTK